MINDSTPIKKRKTTFYQSNNKNSISPSPFETNQNLDPNVITPLTIQHIFNLLYEENFSKILSQDKISFFNEIYKSIEKLLTKRCENNSSLYNKYHKLFSSLKIEMNIRYDNEYKILNTAYENYLTNPGKFHYLKNFRKHCINCDSFACHKCSISHQFGKFIEIANNNIHNKSNNIYIKNDDNNLNNIEKNHDYNEDKKIGYVICVNCKSCYSFNCIKMFCSHCNISFFSTVINNNNITNNSNIEKENNIFPATWLNYHCKVMIDRVMRCIKCHNIFYINLTTNELVCLNKKCNYKVFPKQIIWKCSNCSSDFSSRVKLYNPTEIQIFKNSIFKTLLYQEPAAPPVELLGGDGLKGGKLPCCGGDPNEVKFVHNKECSGELFKGRLNDEEIIVCGKCNAINYSDKYIWTCPRCGKKFHVTKISVRKALSFKSSIKGALINKKNNFNTYDNEIKNVLNINNNINNKINKEVSNVNNGIKIDKGNNNTRRVNRLKNMNSQSTLSNQNLTKNDDCFSYNSKEKLNINSINNMANICSINKKLQQQQNSLGISSKKTNYFSYNNSIVMNNNEDINDKKLFEQKSKDASVGKVKRRKRYKTLLDLLEKRNKSSENNYFNTNTNSVDRFFHKTKENNILAIDSNRIKKIESDNLNNNIIISKKEVKQKNNNKEKINITSYNEKNNIQTNSANKIKNHQKLFEDINKNKNNMNTIENEKDNNINEKIHIKSERKINEYSDKKKNFRKITDPLYAKDDKNNDFFKDENAYKERTFKYGHIYNVNNKNVLIENKTNYRFHKSPQNLNKKNYNTFSKLCSEEEKDKNKIKDKNKDKDKDKEEERNKKIKNTINSINNSSKINNTTSIVNNVKNYITVRKNINGKLNYFSSEENKNPIKKSIPTLINSNDNETNNSSSTSNNNNLNKSKGIYKININTENNDIKNNVSLTIRRKQFKETSEISNNKNNNNISKQNSSISLLKNTERPLLKKKINLKNKFNSDKKAEQNLFEVKSENKNENNEKKDKKDKKEKENNTNSVLKTNVKSDNEFEITNRSRSRSRRYYQLLKMNKTEGEGEDINIIITDLNKKLFEKDKDKDKDKDNNKEVNQNQNNNEKVTNKLSSVMNARKYSINEENSKPKINSILKNIDNNNSNIKNKPEPILVSNLKKPKKDDKNKVQNTNIDNKKDSYKNSNKSCFKNNNKESIKDNVRDTLNNKASNNIVESNNSSVKRVSFNENQTLFSSKISIHFIKKEDITEISSKCIIPKFIEMDYRLIRPLGEGSFGVIYLIEENLTKTQYALKRIVCDNIPQLNKIKEELEIVYSLHHPNLIKILKVNFKYLDETTSSISVLMERGINDWNLDIERRKTTKNFYTEKELLNILFQLVSVLCYLQNNKIAHRDIKPQNVLLFHGAVFKITDLGEAKKINNLSKKMTLKGSELFMSPLLFQGYRNSNKEITHNSYKSDVFSLGYCFLFAMTLNLQLIEILRYEENNQNMENIVRKFLNHNKLKYSEKFINIIIKMVQINENDRYDFIQLSDEIKKNFDFEEK